MPKMRGLEQNQQYKYLRINEIGKIQQRNEGES